MRTNTTRKIILTAGLVLLFIGAAGIFTACNLESPYIEAIRERINEDLAPSDPGVEDPPAGITVSETSLTTTEGGGADTFTIVLASKPDDTVEISIASDNEAEGIVTPSNVSFTPEDYSTPITITVTGVDDSTADGDVNYSIQFGQVVSNDQEYAALSIQPIAAVNTDNDSAGITVSENSLFTTEDGGADTFTVVLKSKPSADVTIGISSSNTSEGTVSPSSLIFSPSNYNTPQTVTVTGEDDAAADGPIDYSIEFGPINSEDTNYSEMTLPSISVVNTDNDTKGITVTETTLSTTEASDGTPDDSFQLWLNSQPSANVTISFTCSDATEGSLSTGSLTFTPANYNTAQTVNINGVDDAVEDGNIAYSINFGAVVSTDAEYAAISLSSISATNIDNDSAGITVSTSSITTTEASDGTPDASFTIALNSQPTSDVTITVTSSNTGEGAITSGSTLTFTPASYSAKTVQVTGVDDYYDDGNISYTVGFDVASADSNYNDYGLPAINATNTDNDTSGVVSSPTTSTSSRLTTTEEGGTDTFTVRLNSKPANSVTVSLTSSNGSGGGTLNITSIVFNDYDGNANNDWNDPITVTITGSDNSTSGYTDYFIALTASSVDSNYNGIAIPYVYVRNAAESRTLATPNVTPESTSSNRYGTAQTITITSNDSRCAEQIYYTTNGSTPTTSSTLYTGPFSVTGSNTTITAKAFYQDWGASGTDSEVYVIPYILEASVSTGISVTSGIKYYASSDEVLIPNFSTGKINRFDAPDLSASSTFCSGISNPIAITTNGGDLYIIEDRVTADDRYEYWSGDPKTMMWDTVIGEDNVRAVDYKSNDLYIADDDPTNPKILVFDLSSDTHVDTFGPSMGPDGSLADAHGVTTCNGYVYVADYGNNRIARWRLSDGYYINPVWSVSNPRDVCSDDNTFTDYVYIISGGTGSASVVIYNASSNSYVDWFPVDADARKITINESSGDLFIFRSDGYLDKYSPN